MGVAVAGSLGASALMQHDGRHVVRAALLIETARRLDLGHLLARGNGDPERVLHQVIFVLGGIQQVDPDRAAVERGRRSRA